MNQTRTLQDARQRYIRKVLAHTKGDMEQASRILGITPAALSNLMRQSETPPSGEEKRSLSEPKRGWEHEKET
jgi:DNA-binding NtrC family response regulator